VIVALGVIAAQKVVLYDEDQACPSGREFVCSAEWESRVRSV
jgi:hypothetical protein